MHVETPESVLVICTGNVCRSQFAAFLLDAGLGDVWPGPVQVRSAGTDVAPDAVVCSQVRTRIAAGGGSLPRVRQLDQQMVHGASLILTASSEHRSAVRQLDRGARARTFTLVEAATIVQHPLSPGQDRAPTVLNKVADLAAEMNARRAMTPAPRSARMSRTVRGPVSWDIADGHLSGWWRHRRTLAEIERAVDGLLQGLSTVRRDWAVPGS